MNWLPDLHSPRTFPSDSALGCELSTRLSPSCAGITSMESSRRGYPPLRFHYSFLAPPAEAAEKEYRQRS
jgi:hypothetical protein